MTYGADQLWEEVTYVAYYLHWPLPTILDLEHPMRHRVVEEIGKINTTLSDDPGEEPGLNTFSVPFSLFG
ncbi:DUF6760 family protein [Lentzea sp. NPDC051208]|uniref:DUF6760 family protein n=1 Tax=Lentzea sp. NPDC051208 TaxID=3154642 RepID=UPI00342E7BE6